MWSSPPPGHFHIVNGALNHETQQFIWDHGIVSNSKSSDIVNGALNHETQSWQVSFHGTHGIGSCYLILKGSVLTKSESQKHQRIKNISSIKSISASESQRCYLFIGPRWPWGPIYGSNVCLSARHWAMLLKLNWCDSSWSSYLITRKW